jgi:hypothetical protein
MSVIRSSQFKITTIWPELVNKRLQTVTLQVKESRFTKHNDLVSVKGLLQRRVCYFDYDGRKRKTGDQLQFEIKLNNAGTIIDLDLLTIELIDDYFIFQPRYIGENQAVFEHGFTIVIHQTNKTPLEPETSGSIFPVLADLIITCGEENAILTGPVLFGGAGLKPEMFHCQVDFTDTHMPSIVSGVVHGAISYLNSQNTRLETEFEQPFSLCPELPPLYSSQRLLISGEVTDGHWWFDPNTPKWYLKLKLNYSWKIVRETEINCLTQTGSNAERRRVKIPLFHQNMRLQITKCFRIPAGNLKPHELNICKPILNVCLTPKGILLTVDFLVEVYATDKTGQECYQCHPVTGDELITGIPVADLPATAILASGESQVKLTGFSLSEGDLKVETVIDCQLNLYQYGWLDLNLAANPNGYILGKVLKEQKTFTISGSQTMKLRVRPLLVKEIKVSAIKIHPKIKPGWLHVNGEFQVGVNYLDERQCLREDTFPFIFQDTFLWDILQPTGEVELNCRLEHDSYAINPHNPLQMNYCFQLQLMAENFEKQDLPIIIAREPLKTPSKTNPKENNIHKSEGILPDLQSTDPARYLPITRSYGLEWPQLELEGEICLKMGKAREISNGWFSVRHFNYRNMMEFILVEGDLSGEIEYWDSDGYLRREQADFSFWKCLCCSPNFNPGSGRPVPELDRFCYTPVNVPVWRKGRIKIQCRLKLNPIREEGALL